MKKTPRILTSLLLLGGVAALAGCATTATNPAGTTVDTNEYEYVTPLGSNIPVKVKKGTSAQTASPTGKMSGEQAADMIHRAGGQAPVERGGR